MISQPIQFRQGARDGAARRGELTTAHGTIETPAFMSVATYGAVRGVSMAELRQLGAQIVLANTYHLHERPGEEVVAELGGLHGFTGWDGPWLTDSGGFQVTSLADRVKIDEDGITFASALDGARRRLTPEGVVAIQEHLGPDIAMVLDECRPHDESARGPDTEAPGERDMERAMERTLRWAERAYAAHTRPDQALFGIVQGGFSEALRRRSAQATAAIGFDGHAHGGLGLGEELDRRGDLIEATHEHLPVAAPRYLMGLGRPEDLVDAIGRGVDLFDCVVPTRNARHGVLFTHSGVLRIKNARFRNDARPIDAESDCPISSQVSRAYLRHLFQTGETLGPRLASCHNLRFFLRLMEESRAAIAEGRFASLRTRIAELARTPAD